MRIKTKIKDGLLVSIFGTLGIYIMYVLINSIIVSGAVKELAVGIIISIVLSTIIYNIRAED